MVNYTLICSSELKNYKIACAFIRINMYRKMRNAQDLRYTVCVYIRRDMVDISVSGVLYCVTKHTMNICQKNTFLFSDGNFR